MIGNEIDKMRNKRNLTVNSITAQLSLISMCDDDAGIQLSAVKWNGSQSASTSLSTYESLAFFFRLEHDTLSSVATMSNAIVSFYSCGSVILFSWPNCTDKCLRSNCVDSHSFWYNLHALLRTQLIAIVFAINVTYSTE